MKRSPIKRYTPIRKRRYRKGEETIGKTGRVRLRGKKLEALRRECFERDGFHCRCKYPERGCGELCGWEYDDMAHIVSRGAGGSDEITNVLTMKHWHHLDTHNCGGKPLPPKVKE
jgi:5-methylcytosine-specific restriction endonuclease McrA